MTKSDNIVKLLSSYSLLKRLVASIFQIRMSQEELIKRGAEINKVASNFIDSLIWTRESTLWKAALRLITNASPIERFYRRIE